MWQHCCQVDANLAREVSSLKSGNRSMPLGLSAMGMASISAKYAQGLVLICFSIISEIEEVG